MNRKRIRQMNTALLRRLTGRPTAEYFSGQPLLERLEHVASSDFGRVSYTDAVEILKKNNDKFGSYYVIDGNELKIYDKDGYIRTARKK